MDIEPITLTEGDLYDISDMVCEVTREVLQESMREQQIMLGALRAQLQEHQGQPPQEGAIATYGTVGTSTMEQLLCTKMANNIVLLKGVLTEKKDDDRATVSRIEGMGLKLATLLWDTFHQLQDGITEELHAREGCALQVLSKKKINIEQLSLQRDELVPQNQQIMQIVDEAYQRISEFSITIDLPTKMWIHYLASGV